MHKINRLAIPLLVGVLIATFFCRDISPHGHRWFDNSYTMSDFKTLSSGQKATVVLDAGGNIPITGLPITYTDRSGTTTAANVSQQLAAANSVRKYLLFENTSTDPEYVEFGAAATTASLLIPAGGGYVWQNGAQSGQTFNELAPTTGDAFVCLEGQ